MKQCDALKDSLSFHIKEVEDCQGQITQANAKISGLELQVNNLEDENKRLKAQSSLQSEKLLKTEIKLREYNLVFDGIPETYGEDSYLLHKKIVDVLNHMVVFNNCGSYVPMKRLQRVGPFIRGKNRPVVVHFNSYSDIELLLYNKLQLPKDVFVREDFPSEIETRRRVLRPIFNKARKMPQYRGKCRLSLDHLIIDGKCYMVEPNNNLHQLPAELQPRASAERENDEVIVFFTQGSPFSNFHHAPFHKNNNTYFCNEQYIQASKAQLFRDDLTHQKIMLSDNPYDIKNLGSQVKGFVRQQWEQFAYQVTKECCTEKFAQNKHALRALLETKTKTIGEASRDLFWGVGKALTDVDILDKNWEGHNLLGKVLMEIRDQFKHR